MASTGKARQIDIPGRDQNLDWTLADPTRYIYSKHCEIRPQGRGLGCRCIHRPFRDGTAQPIVGAIIRVHKMATASRVGGPNYIVRGPTRFEGRGRARAETGPQKTPRPGRRLAEG